MAVQLETTTKRFRGLSTDVKPGRDRDLEAAASDPIQTPPVGSVFTETDTGERYIWRGSWPWVRQEQTIEAFLSELIEVNAQILAKLSDTHRGHEEYLWENDVEPE
jgi:hypothetical protein